MNQIWKKLNQIAEKQMAAEINSKNWFAHMEHPYLGQDLYHLALQVRGCESLGDDEILSTFFTADACQLLKCVPNLYWLWYFVKASVECLSSDRDRLIDANAVNEALMNLRSFVSHSTDLSKTPAELSSMELLLRLDKGVILLRFVDKKTEIFVNPIFQLPRSRS